MLYLQMFLSICEQRVCERWALSAAIPNLKLIVFIDLSPRLVLCLSEMSGTIKPCRVRHRSLGPQCQCGPCFNISLDKALALLMVCCRNRCVLLREDEHWNFMDLCSSFILRRLDTRHRWSLRSH